MRIIEFVIADWHFRRPLFISLPFIEVGIEVRRFWRDGKPTPPLAPTNIPVYSRDPWWGSSF